MGQSKKNEGSVSPMSKELDRSCPSETDNEKSLEIFNDTVETDECPRCGFVRQSQQSDDHVTVSVPDILRDIPTNSNKQLKADEKAESKHLIGNNNPFQVTDKTDIKKVKEMNKLVRSIHVGNVGSGVKGSSCMQFNGKHQFPHGNNNYDMSKDNYCNNGRLLNSDIVRNNNQTSVLENQIPMTFLNGKTLDEDEEVEWSNEVTENVKISKDTLRLKSATASPVDQSSLNFHFESYECNLKTDYPEIIDAYSRVTGYENSLERKSITQAMTWLEKGGMYYGKLTMQESRRKLKKSSVGTFLLRDSSDPKYFLSLSVKTHRGTTSIRISHSRGRFRLDCEETAFLKIPSFDCIMKLLQHYTDITSKDSNQNNCVFLESSGRKDTPVLLRKPYFETTQSLQHLCRIKLNQLMNAEQRRRLLIFMEPKIEQYMTEYPYFV